MHRRNSRNFHNTQPDSRYLVDLVKHLQSKLIITFWLHTCQLCFFSTCSTRVSLTSLTLMKEKKVVTAYKVLSKLLCLKHVWYVLTRQVYVWSGIRLRWNVNIEAVTRAAKYSFPDFIYWQKRISLGRTESASGTGGERERELERRDLSISWLPEKESSWTNERRMTDEEARSSRPPQIPQSCPQTTQKYNNTMPSNCRGRYLNKCSQSHSTQFNIRSEYSEDFSDKLLSLLRRKVTWTERKLWWSSFSYRQPI